MDNARLAEIIADIYATAPGLTVSEQDAMRPDLAGLRIFDEPFFGVAAADDPIFTEYKKPGIIGPWHSMPSDWVPGAKSVVSVVFPFTEEVKASNRKEIFQGSMEWMHARFEGQTYQNIFMTELERRLRAEDVTCHIPMLDGGFRSFNKGKDLEQYDWTDEHTYSSNWSERHAAYAAGLGSFALTRAFITKKGVAVRFSSVITDAGFTPTERTCTGVYDYCIRCGACAHRCPAHAISLEGGKEHAPCSTHANATMRGHRYGCGMCQTAVPCESGIPERK
ncbi:MAG: 4Fe-4S binding protein [Clostridia bacterium]|nr:4Fe-4S binding protein [Clostridia bacterium]